MHYCRPESSAGLNPENCYSRFSSHRLPVPQIRFILPIFPGLSIGDEERALDADFHMVQKGVRYRCAKHPTNLRSVPGRSGNGT
jgi:hypothetical protein